ncbi:hypothetical protein [Nocardia acidivorans]|uniref:hypothetical protein n=1 Tax=Nocardia acidivorans TaxID=404580 RepID=UPI000A421CCE|nr:hypothetical protein [Nocardia acidivorans]
MEIPNGGETNREVEKLMIPVIIDTGSAALNGLVNTGSAAFSGILNTLFTGSFGGR